MIWLAVVVELIMLTTLDNRRVFINPKLVISLTKPSGQLVTEKGECIIALADRKFITVRETCEQIRARMEGRIEGNGK
jgi:hypothetical protein